MAPAAPGAVPAGGTSSRTSGRTTAQWQQADAAHFLHPFTDFQGLARKGARIITRADNIYLWDSDGQRILDAMSGLWCVNVGYGQQALVQAATRQMQELPFYNAFFQTATMPAIELAELLAEVLGQPFVTVYTEVKEIEYAEFMKVISPWEREHLLLHV
jgi:putrescine aminotransferase